MLSDRGGRGSLLPHVLRPVEVREVRQSHSQLPGPDTLPRLSRDVRGERQETPPLHPVEHLPR